MTRPEQSKASGPVPPNRYGLPSCSCAYLMAVATTAFGVVSAARMVPPTHWVADWALRGRDRVDLADREAAGGVGRGEVLDGGHVPARVVVGEDGRRRVLLEAVLVEVLRRARDGVGGIVDVVDPVVVLVGGDPAEVLRRRVDRRAAPGVGGRAARCRSASVPPRRSRSGRCARRAGCSARCRSPRCRCRPGSSTGCCTAARRSCTTSGRWTGSSWPACCRWAAAWAGWGR